MSLEYLCRNKNFYSSTNVIFHMILSYIILVLTQTSLKIHSNCNYTGCAQKKKDILNIHIKSEGIIMFSQKFC